MNNPFFTRKKFLTFRQAARVYPAFTEASFRWLRFNGEENGFNQCVVKVGRKVLLNTERFEPWLESQSEHNG